MNELLNPEIYIKGQSNLLNTNPAELNAAKALSMLNSEKLFSLLTPQSDNVNIVIPDGDLGSAALIYSGYKLADDLHGSIGVLGPYRLDYSNIIPMLEYFSSSLENMLKSNRFDR